MGEKRCCLHQNASLRIKTGARHAARLTHGENCEEDEQARKHVNGYGKLKHGSAANKKKPAEVKSSRHCREIKGLEYR